MCGKVCITQINVFTSLRLWSSERFLPSDILIVLWRMRALPIKPTGSISFQLITDPILPCGLVCVCVCLNGWYPPFVSMISTWLETKIPLVHMPKLCGNNAQQKGWSNLFWIIQHRVCCKSWPQHQFSDGIHHSWKMYANRLNTCRYTLGMSLVYAPTNADRKYEKLWNLFRIIMRETLAKRDRTKNSFRINQIQFEKIRWQWSKINYNEHAQEYFSCCAIFQFIASRQLHDSKIPCEGFGFLESRWFWEILEHIRKCCSIFAQSLNIRDFPQCRRKKKIFFGRFSQQSNKIMMKFRC